MPVVSNMCITWCGWLEVVVVVSFEYVPSFMIVFIAMAQVVSRQPLTAEARALSLASPYEICGRQSGTGTDFSPSTSVFPCQYHSASAPYLSSSTCSSYQDKRENLGNLPKSKVLPEMWALDRKVLSRFYAFKISRYLEFKTQIFHIFTNLKLGCVLNSRNYF
jgi:hypothetical protein